MESLLSIGSMESFSFCATLTRNLSNDLEWSKAFLNSLFYGKARLSTGALKWQKIYQFQLWAPSNILKNYWFLLNTVAWDQPSKHGRRSATIPQQERETRTIGSIVIMWHSESGTAHIIRHHLFIKLKFITNVCSSCRTLQNKLLTIQTFIVLIFTAVLFPIFYTLTYGLSFSLEDS